MPYELLTNVASYDSLLGSIRDFLNDTGDWTLHVDLGVPDEGSVGAGGRELVVSQGTCLAGLRSTTLGSGANRLYLVDGIPPYAGSPSFDTMNGNSGVRYDNAMLISASEPSARHLQQFTGPYPKCHLFTNDPSTYCHVAIEVTTGKFRHLHFGNLTKFGTWTGGGYYACTYWNSSAFQIDSPNSTSHSVPFDSNVNVAATRVWTVYYQFGSDKWIHAGADGAVNSVQRRRGSGTFRGGWGRGIYNLNETPFSGLISLAPVVVGAIRTSDTPDTLRFVGQVPDLAAVNIQNLAPGASIFIGSDEWIVFPWVQKNGGTGNENSGNHGIAYRVRA